MALKMTRIFYRLYMFYIELRYSRFLDIQSNHVQLRSLTVQPESLLYIAKDTIVHAKIYFEKASSSISIGERTYIGKSTLICAENIVIGNDVMISWGCTIVDHDSHSLKWEERSNDVMNWIEGKKDWSIVESAPVYIENKAWLGFNVTVLKGITIGEGAVVAACSVVTKDVLPYTLVAGNPAKAIRILKEEVKK